MTSEQHHLSAQRDTAAGAVNHQPEIKMSKVYLIDVAFITHKK